METTIFLTRTRDGYSARFVGKLRQQMIDLFGTDTIPTAYAFSADPDTVLKAIRKSYPECIVVGINE